jgi:DNA repair exonuclease SbcCD ATPase subunit
MAVKHKVLKDFQLLTNDKKIIVLKAKTVLEDYKYVTKNDNVLVEKDIIDNNPDFFAPIDWKEELNTYLRQNKIPQPAVLTKKLVPFIEEMFVIQSEPSVSVVQQPSSDLIQKELEIESRLKRVELKEVQLNSESSELMNREAELIKREKQIKLKEESLSKLESDLEEKERNMDMLILDSNKNLDDKQKELNDKLESKIKEIEERESNLESKSNNLFNYIQKDKTKEVILKYENQGATINGMQMGLGLEPWSKSILYQIINEIENL